MLDRIRSLIARLHEVHEVHALSDRDLGDLGVTREQVLDFLRMPRDIDERVTAMAAIFGISRDELKRDYAQWIDLLTTCGHCADRNACAKMLDKGAAASPAEATFCGNRAVFTAMAGQTA